jgi:hypothetical protein
MAYSRWAAGAAARHTRKEKAGELKAGQVALKQLQEEQAREAAAQKQEAYEHQRELRLAREAAAAEAAAAAAAAGSAPDGSSPGSEWEVLAAQDASGAEGAAAAAEDDEDEDSDTKSGSGGVVLKCVPCKKSFKSQQQSVQRSTPVEQEETNSGQEETAADSRGMVGFFVCACCSFVPPGWRTMSKATNTRRTCAMQRRETERRAGRMNERACRMARALWFVLFCFRPPPSTFFAFSICSLLVLEPLSRQK